MSRILYKKRAGANGKEPSIHVDPGSVGWEYLSFAAFQLASGDSLSGSTGASEVGFVVLSGRCTVCAGDTELGEIGGRESVWQREPPWTVLLPPDTSYEVTARSALHLAVAGAQVLRGEGGPPRLIRPDEVVVEARGEGQTARFLHHILPPLGPSVRLQLVEVYTPAGNWSSFPPHKHDTEDPPREVYLEETYYYQIRPTLAVADGKGAPGEGFALQRVYTADRSLDEVVAAYDGDVVIVPRGYHVVSAMPGYECYYLNAMAGPSKAWSFTVDPGYKWLMNWRKPPVAGGVEA